MSVLTLFYSDQYQFPLPSGHKFPLRKYQLLRQCLEADSNFCLMPARFADREDLIRVHGPEYVNRFLDGTLDWRVMRRIGFPWSEELVARTLASTGGTLLATENALQTGLSGTLAGGTHHASANEGSGFCVFNDIAVSIGWAQAVHRIDRAAVIDLDVHQGDGTAAIFASNESVFTLSIHGARNFPFRKQQSSVDIELSDGTEDETYLNLLEPALDRVWAFRPDLVLFQSGVDGLNTDTLGRLGLTHAGLATRDRLVLDGARSRSIPLVITLGGGYSRPIEPTVSAHAQTFQIAAELFLKTRI
ncbi:MAG TPA: histone deacetylase [Bryobacteraceae bacterium]